MTGHDRYLIYTLLGRSVEVRMPVRMGGLRLKGVVEKVYRDIFHGEVEVTISGESHRFREPAAIVMEEGRINFLYGDLEIPDDREMPEYNPYEEHLNQHLRRTRRTPVSRAVIKVGELKKTPRKRWRTRVAV